MIAGEARETSPSFSLLCTGQPKQATALPCAVYMPLAIVHNRPSVRSPEKKITSSFGRILHFKHDEKERYCHRAWADRRNRWVDPPPFTHTLQSPIDRAT